MLISDIAIIDDCENVTCENGGSCHDGWGNFTCQCISGYTGSYCQTGKTVKPNFITDKIPWRF